MRKCVCNSERVVPLMGEQSLGLEVAGIPWIGGKKNMYKAYVKYFPAEINTLVDLFTGGGTVAFSTPAKKIISNDIDENIINLFNVLKTDRWAEVIDYGCDKESFYEAHRNIRLSNVVMSPMLRAKYTVADIFMSFNNSRTAFSSGKVGRGEEKYKKWVLKNLSGMHEATKMKNMQFICGDAFELLQEKLDDSEIFWFVDPPYINSSIDNNVYYHQMLGDRKQEWLAMLLAACKGKVMLCGYRNKDSDLYDRHLSKAGFHCYELLNTVAFSERVKIGGKKSSRTEYIWVNYDIPDLKEINIAS